MVRTAPEVCPQDGDSHRSVSRGWDSPRAAAAGCRGHRARATCPGQLPPCPCRGSGPGCASPGTAGRAAGEAAQPRPLPGLVDEAAESDDIITVSIAD